MRRRTETATGRSAPIAKGAPRRCRDTLLYASGLCKDVAQTSGVKRLDRSAFPRAGMSG